MRTFMKILVERLYFHVIHQQNPNTDLVPYLCTGSGPAFKVRYQGPQIYRRFESGFYVLGKGPAGPGLEPFYREWVSECCLTPTQQFFSYSMARTC